MRARLAPVFPMCAVFSPKLAMPIENGAESNALVTATSGYGSLGENHLLSAHPFRTESQNGHAEKRPHSVYDSKHHLMTPSRPTGNYAGRGKIGDEWMSRTKVFMNLQPILNSVQSK
jgi:hypothetical protein